MRFSWRQSRVQYAQIEPSAHPGIRLRVRSRGRTVAAVGVAALVLASCSANPGDAPTVEPEEGDVAAPEANDPATEADTDSTQYLREINIGIDRFNEGFNPHLLADQSPLTQVVADLTLPSAFIADPTNASGARLNTDLLESAEEINDAESSAETTNTTGTHIRYQINPGAQWSDGTPVSGNDFRYLRDQIINTPGVAHAAGYEQISKIDISDSGRQVDVYFDGEINDWRLLFRNLLPSHLLRNQDDFSTVLDSVIPAGAGQYRVDRIDVGRGEVRLTRNDRYWGATPAATDTIIFRPAGSDVVGADQLGADQLQAVHIRPTQTSELTYGIVPGTTETLVEAPRQLSVVANLASVGLADDAIRAAVLSTVDPSEVAAIATQATGRYNGQTSSDATATNGAGSSSGAEEAVEQARQRFTEANPLVVAALGNDNQAGAAAFAIAAQLTDAGIPAEVQNLDSQQLVASALPYGEVDLVVSWGESVDTVLQARDRYACPTDAREAIDPDEYLTDATGTATTSSTTSSSSRTTDADTTATSDPADAESSEEATATPSPATPTAPTSTSSPTQRSAADEGVARAGNISGLCDSDIDALLDDATAGEATIAEVKQRIRELSIERVLVNDTVLTVTGESVTIDGSSSQLEWPVDGANGRLASLAQWRRGAEEPTARN